MHDKDRQESFPKLFAKGKSYKCIEHREDAREQDAYHKARQGLATHFHDVTGESNRAENEEDAQQETSE